MLLFQVVQEFLYHAIVVVDDMLVAEFKMKEIVNLNANLAEESSMKDLGREKSWNEDQQREKKSC